MRVMNKCDAMPQVSRKIRAQMMLQNKDMEYLGAQIGWQISKMYKLMREPMTMTLQDFLGICKALRMNPVKVLCEDVLYWKWEEQGK